MCAYCSFCVPNWQTEVHVIAWPMHACIYVHWGNKVCNTLKSISHKYSTNANQTYVHGNATVLATVRRYMCTVYQQLLPNCLQSAKVEHTVFSGLISIFEEVYESTWHKAAGVCATHKHTAVQSSICTWVHANYTSSTCIPSSSYMN